MKNINIEKLNLPKNQIFRLMIHIQIFYKNRSPFYSFLFSQSYIDVHNQIINFT